MAKPELGTKRICPDTGRKFYDMGKSPVISPYTGKVVPIVAPNLGQLILWLAPWRWIFYVLTTAGLLTFLWASIRLPWRCKIQINKSLASNSATASPAGSAMRSSR